MIDILTNLLNIALMIFTLCIFFMNFASGIKQITWKIIIICAVGIVSFLNLTFIPIGIIRTALFVGVTIMLSFLFNLKWYNRILLSLLVFAIQSICEFITTLGFSIIFNIDQQTAMEGIFKLLGIVLSRALLLLILVIIRFFNFKLSYSLTFSKGLALLLIPFSSVIVSLVHINWFIKYPDYSTATMWFNLVCYVAIIISNIIVFYLIDCSYRDAENSKRLSVITELLSAQSSQYEQMQAYNQEILKIQHDHKNFVLGALSELENQNFDAIKERLSSEYESLSQGYNNNTTNSVISTVVKAKSDYALKKGIKIDFEFHEINKINISAIDIAIILGNAIDNAIEAVENIEINEKIINIIAKISHNMIVLVIKNPVAENVDTNHMVSTKRKNGSMGYGIGSMKQLASKYNGEVIFTCQNQIFETNIVLRNNNE